MIEFIESTHTYLVDGIIVPSVTQIMRQASDETYANIPPHILETAAKRGTIVHQAVYDYEVNHRINPDCPIDYLERYRVVKATSRLEPFRQEFMLTATVGLTYAGTIDMLAKIGDKTVLVDIKTSSARHPDLWAIQLAGYSELLRENGVNVDECYILHLSAKSGKLLRIEPDTKRWCELKDEALRNAKGDWSEEITA